MKVTVVLPTYNRAHLVGQAIQSVLDQQFTGWELIIVDDGSTDNTPEVLARFTDPRIRVIRQTNEGIARANNVGFREARGEYAIKLDSDDRYLPHCLARLVAVADQNPDAVLVYGRSQAMDADGRPLPQMTGSPEPFPGRYQASILYGDFVAPIAALIRRTTMERVGLFDADLGAAEDWDMWVRLAGQGRFVFIDEVMTQFRVHPGRSTAPQPDRINKVVMARLKVLDKAFARTDLSDDARSIRRLAYRNVYVEMGLRWQAAGLLGQAFSSYAQAVRIGPNPLETIARIIYLAVYYRLVQRFRGARVLSDTVARWRRQRRGQARE